MECRRVPMIELWKLFSTTSFILLHLNRSICLIYNYIYNFSSRNTWHKNFRVRGETHAVVSSLNWIISGSPSTGHCPITARSWEQCPERFAGLYLLPSSFSTQVIDSKSFIAKTSTRQFRRRLTTGLTVRVPLDRTKVSRSQLASMPSTTILTISRTHQSAQSSSG